MLQIENLNAKLLLNFSDVVRQMNEMCREHNMRLVAVDQQNIDDLAHNFPRRLLPLTFELMKLEQICVNIIFT